MCASKHNLKNKSKASKDAEATNSHPEGEKRRNMHQQCALSKHDGLCNVVATVGKAHARALSNPRENANVTSAARFPSSSRVLLHTDADLYVYILQRSTHL